MLEWFRRVAAFLNFLRGMETVLLTLTLKNCDWLPKLP